MAARGSVDPQKTRAAVAAVAGGVRETTPAEPARGGLAEAGRLTARTLARLL